MASQTLTTFAKLVAVDNFSGPMAKMAATAEAANKRFQAIGRNSAKTMKGLNAGGGIPAMGATLLSGLFIKDQIELETKLNRSRAILDLEKDKYRDLSKEIERLGATYPLSMQDAAQASIEFGTAGLDAAQQIAIFEQAVKGAMASGESVATVAGGVTDVVYGLGLSFKTSAEQANSFRVVNDLLAASAVSANQTYNEFLRGFQKAAPIFKATGTDMREGAVLLGALANAGIKGAKGGTALRTLLIRPLAATPKMLATIKAALASTGQELESFYKKNQAIDRTGAGLSQYMKSAIGLEAKHLVPDLDKILKDPVLKKNATELRAALVDAFGVNNMGPEDASKITEAVTNFVNMGFNELNLTALLSALAKADAGPAVLKEVFGLRHIEKGMALQSQLLSGQLDELRTKINAKLLYVDGEGPVDRFAKIMMSGLPGAAANLKSTFGLFRRLIATSGVVDSLTTITAGLRDLVQGMTKLNPAILNFGGLTLLAAGALAPLGFVFMGIAAAMAPVVRLFAMLGAAGAAGAAGALKMAAGVAALVVGSRGLKAAAVALAAMRLGVVGIAAVGIGGGLAMVAANLREIGEFGKGLGSGFMEGFGDRLGLDANGEITSIDGLGTKLKELFATIFGLDASKSNLNDFFQSGREHGIAFADALGRVVDKLKQMVELLQAVGGFVFGSEKYEAIAANRIAEVNAKLVDKKQADGTFSFSHEQMKEQARIKRLGLEEYTRIHGQPRFQGGNDNAKPAVPLSGANVVPMRPGGEFKPMEPAIQRVQVENNLKQEFHHQHSGLPSGANVSTTTATNSKATAPVPVQSGAARR